MQTVMTKGIIESYSDESRRERGSEDIRSFMGADSLAASLYGDNKPALVEFYQIEKSAGTELVGMDEYGSVTAVSGEKKKIATYGLLGCTAVAVVSEFADGTKRGYIQHYSPSQEQLSGLVLRREMGGVAQQSPVRCKMVIMTPGEHCKDPDGKWIMTPMFQERVDNLIVESSMKNSNRDVKIYPYSMYRLAGEDEYGQGSLMIEFSSDGETKIYTEMLSVKFDEGS